MADRADEADWIRMGDGCGKNACKPFSKDLIVCAICPIWSLQQDKVAINI